MANNDGMTPLHYAAEKGRKDLLHLLISKGADIDAESVSDGTPLHCAANGMKDAVKILLDNHANPNIVACFSGTPLFIAIAAGCIGCVRLLLQAGADPNLSSTGKTPLIIAALVGGIEVIKCLLKAGADPNITNFYDVTPVEFAALYGRHAEVEALFQVTTRIQSIPDWSPRGILEYVYSNEAKHKTSLKLEPKFREAKDHAAQAFKSSDYHTAIFWYSVALDAKPLDAAVLSNRSLCFARLNEGGMAIKDALSCIKLREDWPKAYNRAGVAWNILGEKKKAVEAFEMGLKLDPKNKELQDAYQSVRLSWS